MRTYKFTTPTGNKEDKVSALWTGEQEFGKWFPGTICKIDVDNETMEVAFDDGDYDKKVSWQNVIIV